MISVVPRTCTRTLQTQSQGPSFNTGFRSLVGTSDWPPLILSSNIIVEAEAAVLFLLYLIKPVILSPVYDQILPERLQAHASIGRQQLPRVPRSHWNGCGRCWPR